MIDWPFVAALAANNGESAASLIENVIEKSIASFVANFFCKLHATAPAVTAAVKSPAELPGLCRCGTQVAPIRSGRPRIKETAMTPIDKSPRLDAAATARLTMAGRRYPPVKAAHKQPEPDDDPPPVPPDRRPVRPVEEPPGRPGRDVPEPPVEEPDRDRPRRL